MGFWGSLKAGVSETAKLVDHGSQALLEAAEQLNQRSEIWSLKKTIEMHVREVDKNAILGESFFYFENKKAEILRVLDEIIDKGDAGDVADAISEKKVVSEKIDKYSLDSIISRISEIEREISNAKSLKPKIKKAKYDECVRLIERATAYKSVLGIDSTQALIQKKSYFQKAADESEKLRYQRKQELFSDGHRVRRVLSLRDEKLHGEQKEWYENGQLRIVASFWDGNFTNELRFYTDDGVLAFEGTYDHSAGKAIGVLFMGDRVILRQEINKSGSGAADIWLWNGVKAVRLNVVNFKIDRSFLFLKACLRPMVIFSLFRAWQRKEEYHEFSRMSSMLGLWESEFSRFVDCYID